MHRKNGRLALGVALAVTFMMNGVGGASAHFNFALPEEWYMNVARGNDVELMWGHPYEGIYFDAPAMTAAGVVEPDGTKTALTPSQMTVEGHDAWKLSFTPVERGDYIVYADFEALVVPEEEVAWEDHVKAIVHYKVTGGWAQSTGQIIEIIPLTRPYGLEEGFVFVGKAIYNGSALGDASVEIEKYYPVGEVPDPLPEEPMITREMVTDENGVFVVTLDEPGVWVICVAHTVGTQGGYDKDIRGILMVPVEEKFPPEAGDDLEELTAAVDDLTSENTGLRDRVGSLEGLLWASVAVAVIAIIIAVVAVAHARRD